MQSPDKTFNKKVSQLTPDEDHVASLDIDLIPEASIASAPQALSSLLPEQQDLDPWKYDYISPPDDDVANAEDSEESVAAAADRAAAHQQYMDKFLEMMMTRTGIFFLLILSSFRS